MAYNENEKKDCLYLGRKGEVSGLLHDRVERVRWTSSNCVCSPSGKYQKKGLTAPDNERR